jgi:diguanylate cyclase (GGDEF)-like protein
VRNLYDVFELEPLDEAEIPQQPARPNVLLNLLLGAVAGLILGIVLVFLAEYLFRPVKPFPDFNIIDSETGAFNLDYLKIRLKEEISRTNQHSLPFSLSLIRLKVDERVAAKMVIDWNAIMRWARPLIEPELRQEDVLVRFDEATFAVILPLLPVDSSRHIMESISQQIRSHSITGLGSVRAMQLYASAGIVIYQSNNIVNGYEELLNLASMALSEADKAPYGGVNVLTFSSSGYDLEFYGSKQYTPSINLPGR